MIGRTIGKYRIIGQLGRGGMGTVYKAVDRTLEREVAIKVLNPELADTQVMRRFRQEAVTLAKLNHPEIATIYELLKSDADLLMVMELVRGETLDSICARLAPLSPEHAVYVTDRILSALGYAHNAGIVHCDMKPGNVMVTGQGSVKIMDFGIAHVRGADRSTPGTQMIGTPAYMPPEQVLGQDVDARSDLYAVGIIFYRLLTGHVPFNAPTAIGMVQQQISDPPTPLHVHREGLPDWCEPLLQRALAKSQADRFQTAEEFREKLQEAAGNPQSAAGQAFFGSVVDLGNLGPAEMAQPGVLERLGLTRGLTRDLTHLWGTTSSPIGSVADAAAGVPATIVLPRRRGSSRAVLVALSVVGVVALAGLAGWWRHAAPPSSAVPAPVASAPASTNAAASVVAASPAMAEPPPATPAARPSTVLAAGSPTMLAEHPATTSVATLARPRVDAAVAGRGETPSIARADVPASTRAEIAPPTRAELPSAPPTPVSAIRSAVQNALPFVFDAIALVNPDDHPLERAAQVFLIDGMINVKATDDEKLLYSVPLDSVLSIAYSGGRDPLWKGPTGPVPVAHGPMGLGIFRGVRHWVSLRTQDAKTRFVVLRLGSAERAKSAITALEQRTGRASVALAENVK